MDGRLLLAATVESAVRSSAGATGVLALGFLLCDLDAALSEASAAMARACALGCLAVWRPMLAWRVCRVLVLCCLECDPLLVPAADAAAAV